MLFATCCSVLMLRNRSRAKSKRAWPGVASKALYAASAPSTSDWGVAPNRFLLSSAASRASAGIMNGDREPSSEASVSASSVMPSAHPKTTNFPSRASVGSWLRSLPSGVKCSSSCAKAPMHRRSSTALCTAAGSGGSGRRAHTCSAEPGRLSALTRMTSCCRPTRRTSGSVYRFRGASLGKRWNAIPGRTRPARPRRCFAAAALTATSSSEDMSRSASYRSSLTRPVSMTHTTSSMVMEVSATLVDSTTFTFPGGGRWNTLRWSSGGSAPCRGSTHSGSSAGAPVWPARAALCDATATRLSRRLSISLVPGRKIKIAVPPAPAPPSSFSRSSVCAVPRSQRSSRAPGNMDSARSTSPAAASTNQRTSSQMSC